MLNYEGLQVCTNKKIKHLGGNILEGDPFTFSPLVWDCVITRFAIQSVLDLGSGLGYAANYFYKKGLRVVAIDGLSTNVQNAVYPTLEMDLTEKRVNCRVDLVHCQELVEHIDEKFIDNVLSSLATGKFILMTNALPHQSGYHHINEQKTEYWIDHLKRYQCHVLVEDTARIRQLAQTDGAMYLAQTGLILANRSRY